MELSKIKISGFEFVKIAEFFINQVTYKVTKGGKPVSLDVSIKLIDQRFEKLDESAYVIMSGEEIVYVGEFSYSLKHRWIKGNNYAWHGTVDKIKIELQKLKPVSLWVTANPFSRRINISKSIEHEILKTKLPPWNIRGQIKKHKKWREKNCRKITQILQEIEQP